jgi:hypothetical protein
MELEQYYSDKIDSYNLYKINELGNPIILNYIKEN